MAQPVFTTTRRSCLLPTSPFCYATPLTATYLSTKRGTFSVPVGLASPTTLWALEILLTFNRIYLPQFSFTLCISLFYAYHSQCFNGAVRLYDFLLFLCGCRLACWWGGQFFVCFHALPFLNNNRNMSFTFFFTSFFRSHQRPHLWALAFDDSLDARQKLSLYSVTWCKRRIVMSEWC